nr:galactosyltransferase-related protein [Bacillus timonensis]
MNNVSILIPYNSDGGHRDKVIKWVLEFYKNTMPEFEVVIGNDTTGQLFSRSKAINNAARKASGSIYVIADADIVYNPIILYKAIDLLKYNVPWIIPYNRIKYLTEDGTHQLLNSTAIWPFKAEIEFYHDHYSHVGGLNVISKKNFEIVGGFDERFIGWGGEDDAFASSVNSLCGDYHRMKEDLYHIWHPPAAKFFNNPHYKANKLLSNRYLQASNSEEDMRKLIQERKLVED